MESTSALTQTASGADLRYRNLYRLGGIAAFMLEFLAFVETAIFGWPPTAFSAADRALTKLKPLSCLMLPRMGAAILSAMAFNTAKEIEAKNHAQDAAPA
jgi:hypothetical protein